jgi:phage tail sheath gpL-like
MAISTAVDVNAVASVVGIESKFQQTGLSGRFLPQKVGIVAQGTTGSGYPLIKKQVTSAFEAGNIYGFGSPIHLAVSQLLPSNSDGVGNIPVIVYPLDDAGTGVAASGDITPSGAETEPHAYRVSINNILSEPFVVSPGDVVADITDAITTAVNSNINMPVTAIDATTEVVLTAKWKGASSDDLYIEVIPELPAGSTSFIITQPTGGLVNPDIQDALDLIGENEWITMLLNCLNKSDTVTLGKYTTFGEGRWEPLVKKPLIVFTGDINATVDDATTIPEARKTDRVNSQLVSPASVDLPFIVAARQLARIVVVAENNPPTGYNGQIADGLTPADDSLEWKYSQRDEAIKKGSSTITVENGQVVCGDIATFYHPDGMPIPAYRFVVNIVKLQNVTYNMDLIFSAPEWRDVPLIPDGQPTVNPKARTPGTARAEVAGLLDYLGEQAIISDPEDAKKKTVAAISGSNPNRLDVSVTFNLSGNTRVKSITQNFSYFLGGNQ